MGEIAIVDADYNSIESLGESEPKKRGPKSKKNAEVDPSQLINPLRNERVVVRFIKKKHPLIDDPKHVAAGGLVTGGKRRFSLPILSSGNYKNCLTNNEKDFLEYALSLEPNALSIYKKNDNFWDSGEGNAEITLGKEDVFLDLSSPHDYIIYKMLLANSDYICPSLKELENNPKASYQYVLVNENDEARIADNEMGVTAKCYMMYGKYQDDANTLRTLIEILENKNIDDNTQIEFLRQQINNEIKLDPKRFLGVVSDEYFETKVIIRRAAKNGIISKRGTFYYLTEDNSALSEGNEDPTLDNAARYISSPKRMDLFKKIQAKLNPR